MPGDRIDMRNREAVREALAVQLRQLNEKELESLTEVVFDELELRCGSRLADMLTAKQFEEFDSLINGGDEEAAFALVDRAIPNPGEIVVETMTALINETVQRIKAADERAGHDD